jgi:serine/threonine protein kinase
MVICSYLHKNKCKANIDCKFGNKGCVKKTNQKPKSKPVKLAQTCKHIKCPPGKVTTPVGNKCVDIEYIDAGGFGCVVNPPIVDKTFILTNYIPYKNKNNTDIAKLFRRQKYFVEELKYLNIIANLDPERKITVDVKGAQEILGKCLLQSKNIANCLVKGDNIDNKSFYQIILEHGGIRVNKRDTYKLTYVQFLQCMKKLTGGMINLQENNIVHRDVKPDNVLYKSSQNKLNLIDFGLMCTHYSELYDPNNRGSMNILNYKEYHTYPPEFFVAYIMFSYRSYYDGNKAKFNNFLDNDLLQKLHNYGFFHTDFLMYNSALRREYGEGIRTFIETMKASGMSRSTDVFNRDIAMKADVFAFAYIIASLKRNIVSLSEEEQEFIDILYRSCIRANPYDRATFLELYSILSSEYMRSVSPIGSLQYRKGGNIIANIKQKVKSKLQPFLSLTVSKIQNLLDRRMQSPPRKYTSPRSSPKSHRVLTPLSPLSENRSNHNIHNIVKSSNKRVSTGKKASTSTRTSKTRSSTNKNRTSTNKNSH